MGFFRHRRRTPVRPSAALVVLLSSVLVTAGCAASEDESAKTAAPSPDAKTAAYCRSLHQQLPRRVGGQDREDPEPGSEFTAGWGDPAIILRCGVPRPAEMNDPEASGVEVNGVGWLLEKQDDGSFRFTSTLRQAYVEVTLPRERTHDGLAPLTDIAVPVRKTVPEGIAG